LKQFFWKEITLHLQQKGAVRFLTPAARAPQLLFIGVRPGVHKFGKRVVEANCESDEPIPTSANENQEP